MTAIVLIGLNLLFCHRGIEEKTSTLNFANSEESLMIRGDNRHEILVVLIAGHFTVIFNSQECGIKEKA